MDSSATLNSVDSGTAATSSRQLKKKSTTATSVSPVHRPSTSDDDSGCAIEEYAWVPAGLKPDLVRAYFACLPEERVPYVNSAGETWRVRQLLFQLPPQDSEARYCRYLTTDEQRQLDLFCQQRKRSALGRARVAPTPAHTQPEHAAKCHQCGSSVLAGELSVSTSRGGGGGGGRRWHAGCFVCRFCRELLVDLIYFHHGDGNVYCGRHHAELFKPRCHACDELIFSEECTEAEGQSWHMRHFACFECDLQLGGQRYVMKNEKPYCVSCYEAIYAEKCESCGRVIGVDERRVEQRQEASWSKFWHANSRCCCCTRCKRSLVDRPFLSRGHRLYCHMDCYTPASPPPRLERKPPASNTCQRMAQSMIQSRLHYDSDDEDLNPPAASAEALEHLYETVRNPAVVANTAGRTRRCSPSADSASTRSSYQRALFEGGPDPLVSERRETTFGVAASGSSDSDSRPPRRVAFSDNEARCGCAGDRSDVWRRRGHRQRRRCSSASSASSSSSDTDAEVDYLAEYLAAARKQELLFKRPEKGASLLSSEGIEKRQQEKAEKNKRRTRPAARTANNNCIVS